MSAEPAHHEMPSGHPGTGYDEVKPEVARLLRIATFASVATASVLIAAKSGAWLMTGSVSVLSTLIDSLMDAAASLVNLIAVRNAYRQSHTEHRIAQGK